MNAKPKNLLGKVLLTELILFSGYSVLMGLLSGALGGVWLYLVSTVGIFFVFAIPVLLYLNGAKFSLSELVFLSKKTPYDRTCKLRNSVFSLIFAVAVTVSAVNVTSVLEEYVFSLLGIASQQSAEYTVAELVLIFIRNVLISSLLEELLFRGVVLNETKDLSTTVKVLIGALLFALMHCSLHSFFYAFAAGAAITYFTIRSSSVLFGIIIHALQNLFAFAFTVLRCYAPKDVCDLITAICFYSLIVLAVIGLCLMIVRDFKKRTQNAPENTNTAISLRKSGILTPELAVFILAAAVITAISF